MPCFRCDFEVKSDLAVRPDQTELRARLAPGHEIIIRNDALDAHENIPGLVCSVIGDAEDIEGTQAEFRTLLARYLDVLAFATQSTFLIEKPRRLMDWEPGQRDRRMMIFETFPQMYPPEPGLDASYLATVSELEKGGIPDFARVALKYFRYGFLEPSPEDQFMRFWLALEVIAENTKPTEKIAIPCVECGQAAKCAHCGDEPLRRPMATDAIRAIIAEMAGDIAAAVSKRQLAARNSIMHGRSVEALEAECKMPIGRVLNELVEITHRAILEVLPLPEEGPELLFGYRDDFAVKKLTVSMIGEFRHDGSDLQPTEDRLPSAQISIIGRDQKSPDRDA